MKVILVLLSCMVAVSFQYGYWPYQQYPYSQFYGPYGLPYGQDRPYYSPFRYQLSPYYAQQIQQQLALQQQRIDPEQQQPKVIAVVRPIVAPVKEGEDDESKAPAEIKGAEGEEIAARVAASLNKLGGEKAEGRGFFLPALLLGKQIFTTSTSYVIITSTLTSLSVQSCIPAASFYGGSTQSCRRRREIAEIQDHIDELQESIEPSALETVEATARVSRSFDDSEVKAGQSELQSSINEDQVDRQLETAETGRASRQFTYNYPNLGFGTTVFRTITSYSISLSASRKTVLIGSSLSCLPVGYNLC